MASSENGWQVIDTSAGLDKNFAPVSMPSGVLAGDVATVLGYLAHQFDARVEKLVEGYCWGYYKKQITGGSGYSNHASATAIDLNAPFHPQGKRGTFTAAQRITVRQIISEVGGVVRWGADYSGTVDEMHFEIYASSAAVRNVARHLDGTTVINPTNPEEDEPMIVKAAQDDYVSIPCNGKTQLFISTAFGRKVKVLQVTGVRDNQGGKPAYSNVAPLKDINPDEPGPIGVEPGTRAIQLRYSADHDFTAWCA